MTAATLTLLALVAALQSLSLTSEDDYKPIDRVADALAAGDAASAVSDSLALLSAAKRLDRLAAHPVEGQDDIATRWRQQSLPRGADNVLVPTRGRTLGPSYRGGQLAGGASLEIEQIFFGGEAAVVVIVPQSGRILKINVADITPTTVCAKVVKAPKTACRWLPIFTTRYRINVVNPSTLSARYYLISN